MYQKIFNLIPLVGYITEDPYLAQNPDAQEFLQQYLEMNKLIRFDLL